MVRKEHVDIDSVEEPESVAIPHIRDQHKK